MVSPKAVFDSQNSHVSKYRRKRSKYCRFVSFGFGVHFNISGFCSVRFFFIYFDQVYYLDWIGDFEILLEMQIGRMLMWVVAILFACNVHFKYAYHMFVIMAVRDMDKTSDAGICLYNARILWSSKHANST